MKALDSKRLAGANVAVMNPGPLPKGHPLCTFDNVVITAHIAAGRTVIVSRWFEPCERTSGGFAESEPLMNLMVKQKGH